MSASAEDRPGRDGGRKCQKCQEEEALGVGGGDARDGGRLDRWCPELLSVRLHGDCGFSVLLWAESGCVLRVRPGDRKHACDLNREKLSGRTRRELAHLQGSANGTLRRKQRRGQGQRVRAQGAGPRGGAGCWGAGCPWAMALGECGHTGTAGTSTALQAECCPHDPAPASDAGEEGAECSVLRGRARDAGPARPLCPLLPSPQLRPHTESLCLLMFVKWLFRVNLVQGLLRCMWPRGLGMFHVDVSG